MADNWGENANERKWYGNNKPAPSNSNYQSTGGDNWGGAPRYDGPSSRNWNKRPPQPTHIIKVPSKYVGRIIGKGGSKISDLQYESGAVIQVTKEVEGDETKIKIIGGAEETKRAEEMIMSLTVERDQRPRSNFQVNMH